MAMTNTTLLKTPSAIDLSKHGVIEAHAGTGKTYTIVHFVLRILSEKVNAKGERIHIRNILLVTYTDKAAGDLKKRIREGLVKAIAEAGQGSDLSTHLSDCLNNLHEALIGTIHSVCLRILRTWPFETGVQFQTKQCAEDDGLSDAFYHIVRTDWQQRDGDDAKVIALLQENGMEIKEDHVKLIKDLAKQLLNDKCAMVDAEKLIGFTDSKSFLEHQGEAEARCAEINEEFFTGYLERWIQRLEVFTGSTGIDEKSLGLILGKIAALNVCMAQRDFLDEEWILPKKFGKDLMIDGHRTFFRKNKPLVLAYEAQMKKDLKAAEKRLKFAKGAVETPYNAALTALIAGTAQKVAKRWQQVKLEEGFITFQDMLRLTHCAVKENPTLVMQLRERLAYGIIDEFQDTSVLQWEIFKEIFVGDLRQDPSRLYIVGDPKQSIYAFQGADVSSYAKAKREVLDHDGKLYGLIENYRSIPQLIECYNSILNCPIQDDWFLHGDISYQDDGVNAKVAQAPDRKQATPDTVFPTVQVIQVSGGAEARRDKLSEHISTIIRAMVNKSVSVPEGPEWKPHVLRYEDFAVIVENHNNAEPVLAKLAEDGIPAVKYKLSGVYQSSMSRQVCTLLKALDPAGRNAAKRTAALLTSFFEKHPVSLDQAKDLEPSAPEMRMMEKWEAIIQMRRWSQLFASIIKDTKVETRLVRLSDGERQLCDLDQVVDHCIECLVQRNWTLTELTEHLGQLLEESSNAGEDEANLHSLATAQSAVKVLTMHASKGLEFPVVFLVLATSEDTVKPPCLRRWNDSEGKLHLVPETSEWPMVTDEAETERRQERRRKLYVALTRPQVTLFVPQYFNADGELTSGIGGEADLSPRLQELLDDQRQRQQEAEQAGTDYKPKLSVFNEAQWLAMDPQKPKESNDHLDPAWSVETDPAWVASYRDLKDRLRALGMQDRRSLQTSYTELSHELENERELGPSEENSEPEPDEEFESSDLPRGKDTGDALHLVLEECVEAPDWNEVPIRERLKEHLERNRVLKRLDSDEEIEKALNAAERMVKKAMEFSYDMGAPWGKFSLAALKANPNIGNCRAELEFQLAHSPDWLHGFMDVVFRVRDESNPRHPWRYHVLDWKTNSLPKYNLAHIGASVKKSHYDLQAQVYAHALHRFLEGLLQSDYDPKSNLGTAVYVYLRGFELHDELVVHVHEANSVKDADYVSRIIANWKEKR